MRTNYELTEEDLLPHSRISEEDYEDIDELSVWDYWKEDYYQENKHNYERD